MHIDSSQFFICFYKIILVVLIFLFFIFAMRPKKAEKKSGRKLITIETKREIIALSEGGMRVMDLAKKFEVSHSTISTILSQKPKIKKSSVAEGVSILASLSQRPPLYEEMEKMHLFWIKEKQMAGDTISQETICQKARSIFYDLKKEQPCGSSDKVAVEFQASRGWFDRFKSRTGIHSVARHGEAASADFKAAEECKIEFQRVIQDMAYLPQQIFNCDETGLFWKKMPKRTFIAREEKKLPGHKPMKDRLTLLLCANSSSDLKLKPMLIYHSQNPRAFKKLGMNKSSLGVFWQSNKRAWVGRTEFVNWFRNVFAPSVKSYLLSKGLPLHAILTMDNAPGHPKDILEKIQDYSWIKIFFFPPNVTSLVQPMDQLVIANFKKLYTRAIFKMCFEVCDGTCVTLASFWKNEFNVAVATKLIVKAWAEVSSNCLKAAWRQLCPYLLDFDDKQAIKVETQQNHVVQDILQVGGKMNLEVDKIDLDELMDEHNQELSHEVLKELALKRDELVSKDLSDSSDSSDIETEAITVTEIREALEMWEKLQTAVIKWNPNKAEANRAASIFNDQAMEWFWTTLKNKQRQTTLEKYFSL